MNIFLKGEIIRFGKYNWRILDIQDGSALIITENIIDKRRYDNNSSQWANSEIRNYLNGEFFNSFVISDQTRIIMQTVKTLKISKTPRYGTDDIQDVFDYIFCLSYDEVYRYFSDNKKIIKKQKKVNKNDWYIDDENNDMRQAKFEGKNYSWWLRPPGNDGLMTARVLSDGRIRIHGGRICTAFTTVGGVRPALWLKLEV